MSRITLRIDLEGHGSIGPGKVRLLELVGEAGSIQKAAAAMGMSYAHAWKLLQELAHRVRSSPRVTLRELLLSLDGEPSREALIGSFCALLELVKLGVVGVEQTGRRDEIGVVFKQEHESDLDGLLESSVFDDETPLESAAPAETAPLADAPHAAFAPSEGDDDEDGETERAEPESASALAVEAGSADEPR